jgi:hypothetical protein
MGQEASWIQDSLNVWCNDKGYEGFYGLEDP